jgi:hypothetical protein
MFGKNKRGQSSVWGLVGLVMALGIVGIVLAVVVYVLATLVGTGAIASNVNATSAVNTAINAIMSITSWLGLIVTVSIAALVIGDPSRRPSMRQLMAA